MVKARISFEQSSHHTRIHKLPKCSSEGAVTVATQSASAAEQRIRDAFMLVRADGLQLGQIGDLIDAGELRIFVHEIFPLAKAREAYSRASQGNMRGKVAISVLE